MTRQHAGIALGLLVVAVVAQLPTVPAHFNDWADNGAYAYSAQVIRDGGMPYRDAWDHKPPLIAYLNALAFTVGGETYWALWGLRVISTWVTA
ncbi:MAG: hypothetical protein GYB65_17730, partial [Chloroflexi bacterium]|nr:hypothetical protein [Chloroflexota bacterium]